MIAAPAALGWNDEQDFFYRTPWHDDVEDVGDFGIQGFIRSNFSATNFDETGRPVTAGN